MSATSRDLVWRTLRFQGPARAPREIWVLPIASSRYPRQVEEIQREFPGDFDCISGHEREAAKVVGDPYEVGEHVDAWGCRFINIQAGVIGEVKDPMVKDWDADRAKVHVPREWLSIDRDAVNHACASTSKFTAAGCCPRPFEQLQFIRGSENVYCDLVERPREMMGFLREMHEFYVQLMEAWAKTDVDSLRFMDDWGSQRGLLISPGMWREIFKPMYREYAQIAHAHGKAIFMHSDGHILSIFPDLVEIGVDAVNSQVFCMGIDELAPFAGKITFWGEIDRQRLLVDASVREVDAAVREVHAKLWRNGGCIAQCEFGAGARPENVRQVFASWMGVGGSGLGVQ